MCFEKNFMLLEMLLYETLLILTMLRHQEIRVPRLCQQKDKRSDSITAVQWQLNKSLIWLVAQQF